MSTYFDLARDLARSQCLVSASDYAEHWEGKGAIDVPVWSGEERRIGVSNRRGPQHDRRWDKQASRRFRLSDRRHV